eukprot:CAMPEP_0118954756 /NCGR_PEP_ID=MMETSP1169-20130426/58828_1 /TAXON_ID=36882 /ORGANISM="Pyramimonas obovata, Strain CCMP722" /LENGTH=352 /DNA_ID=CAMNT_0006902443 /DNA_START=595 /DNA_END=1650 /DNA_ORIENTATION=-
MSLPERIEGKVHKQAAGVVGRLLKAQGAKKGGASLKSLTLAPNIIAKKATYAICCETLKYLSVIRDIIGKTDLLDSDEVSAELAYVLVYELLLGKGCRPVAAPEKHVLSYKAALQSALKRKMMSCKVKSPAELLPAEVRLSSKLQSALPRYVRVNTLQLSVEEAVAALHRHKVERDEHLDDLLVLPPGTDLHKHPLTGTGLVLQGKGSCMPAVALKPQAGWEVIDACAAPGNKTTHLAARMRGKGKVYAFDADRRRLRRLKANIEATGASIVTAKNADFLSVDPLDYPQVRAVLLDPSCSGSGTEVVRGDILLASTAEVTKSAEDAAAERLARLEGLVKFQEAALLHALSFP